MLNAYGVVVVSADFVDIIFCFYVIGWFKCGLIGIIGINFMCVDEIIVKMVVDFVVVLFFDFVEDGVDRFFEKRGVRVVCVVDWI